MADAPQSNDDEIDLNALLGTLIDHKWFIAIVTGVFFVAAAAYAVLATPVYQANGLVQVEQKVPNLPGLTALTQTLGASSSEATTEIAIIQSRSVVGEAVKNLNLDIVVEPHRFPLIGNFIARRFKHAHPGEVAAPWLGLARDDWGGATLDVFQLDVPAELLGQPLTLVAGAEGNYELQRDGARLLRGKVGEVAQGNGITMQVKSLHANAGMRFDVTRNRNFSTVLKLQQLINASEQGKDSGIIQLTYENADPKLAVAVLNQIQTAYVRQNVEKNSEQAANSLQFVKQQLPGARQQLEKAQTALNAFQVKAHSVDVTLQTKALLDQVVGIDTSIQQLKIQQADIARRFTANHPAYKALMEQIGALQSQKDKMQGKIDELPDTQKELLGLTEDVQVSNTTYTSLLNQAQQLEIARAGSVGNVRIVDAAATDITKPVKPKRALVVVAGVFLGAFVAVAFVFLRQMLNRGIEDPAEIEKLGLPVYAAVPLSLRESVLLPEISHHHGDGRQHLLAVDTPADLAIEALRSLRTSLHFAKLESRNNLLMISGSSPGVGKSFISSNLAAVMAQAGQRVLLIDADLRKGSIHRIIGGQPAPGLSELISGQTEMSATIKPVDNVENLHFLPRGKVPPNPSELLMHPSFKALLDGFMAAYDLVIIDTAPILAVTDAALVGQHAGMSLLTVRFGLNQAREVELAKQRFEHNGVKIKGAVFNAVERRTSGYYSYGYYEYGSVH